MVAATLTIVTLMPMAANGRRAGDDRVSLRYCIEHNITPADSMSIDPGEIERGLRDALAVPGDTLDWNSWEQVRPWLTFVNQIGWDNQDYLEYTLNRQSLYPLKSYVTEALEWVEAHKTQLSVSRIYKVLNLWDRYVHRSGERAYKQEESDSIVEALYELVIED